jgi:acid phosphatase (class A)
MKSIKTERVTLPCIILLLVCSQAAIAATPTTKPAKSLTFLSKNAVDIAALLPDPPAKGSEEEEAEFWVIMAEQEGRTPAEVDRAKSEIKFDAFAFNDVLGPSFNAEQCPQTAALFKDVFTDAKVFSNAAKLQFGRRRPYLVDNRIHPVLELEDEGSYPSGHSTRGMVTAELLAEIFPEQRAALLDRGRQIGWDRVIGGVHYPSDVAAGRVLGHALAQALLANDAFKTRFEQVKTELAQIHKPAPAAAAQ